MKHLPNAISVLRIPLSVAALAVPPFSELFWLLYLSGGLTDMLDGLLARRLHQVSPLGATLDSVADFVFAGCLIIFAVKNVEIPLWLWLCASAIALLRFAGYGIGFYRYRGFTALHTRANKLTGVLIFASPVLYCLCGLMITGIILCAVAAVSACEELVIIIGFEGPDRDCKGIFAR